jgi:argininosuccinate lyase
MTLLWAKGSTKVVDDVQRFLAGEDVHWDQILLPFDIRASAAHARGLVQPGLLSAAQASAIVATLDELAGLHARGEFVLDARFEDGHSAIEAVLTDKLGDIGKRVHAGRSRNDQVLVALRLYMRDRLDKLVDHLGAAARAFLGRAREHAMTPMPGYTHLQQAVPSSVGLWFAAFAEAMIDNAVLARLTRSWLDACPLGTAAGYGVPIALDREGVAAELGFARLQLNPMYAQNSRGKHELAVLGACTQALLDVRRFAWDVSIFTTAEFGFVGLPEALTTGSSIMPNKRNPDVVELLRASCGRVLGATAEIASTLSLPSGYHRDLQATKGPFLQAVEHTLSALALVPDVVKGLTLRPERMRQAIEPDTYATDRAIELALSGVPFRDAYRQVGEQLDQLGGRSPEASINARVSPGACADLRLDELEARLSSIYP